MSLYTRSPRAAGAARSAREWVKIAGRCWKDGDRGGAALALRIAGSFRRYAATILEREGRR